MPNTRMTAATERAIGRANAGQSVSSSARDEGIDPSTLFRALKRQRETDAKPARVVIAGAGSLGRELMGWLRLDGRTEEIVFIDDGDEAPHALCSVIARIGRYEPIEGDQLLIAIADPKQRAGVASRLGIGSQARRYIAAGSVVAEDALIDAGSLLFPHSVVSTNARLGRHCIVNTHATVGHDVVIGDFCTVSSHVDITGHVKVGDRVLFGSGAIVLPRISIGDDAVIGAGAVVVRDVPPCTTVFGNPARAIA